MYYIINPLTWPFTVIPNLPQNLIEVIDSPLPLLIGMIGYKDLAEEIYKIRGGNDNIIIIEKETLKYYKEAKITFNKEPLKSLKHSLEQNYSEFKILKKKNVKNANFCCINEKIYKNIYGAIKSNLCQKIDSICEKYKNQLRKSVLGTNVDALSSQELELRQKINNEFANTYSDKKKKVDFYRIFAQTQIFASYLDKYIENNK